MSGYQRLLFAIFGGRGNEDEDEREDVAGMAEALGGVLTNVLTPREHRVLQLRFGLEDNRCRTLKVVGDDFFVSPERIRQIEKKALRRLRKPNIARGLKVYL